MELWRAGGRDTISLDPGSVEAEGWDGQMFMDSQSLGADPYALMGFWAARTQRLQLAPGVTNPLTRHPAVTAASAATTQMLSNGRAVLGIGRGDSALAYLGYSPAPVRRFERTLDRIQTLLGGGEVAFGGDDLRAQVASSDRLALGDRPTAARLTWLPDNLPKVPLDVAATGPRVIEIAARLAERVTISVGAMPKRVSWAIEVAHKSSEHAATAPSLGAQVVVVCHARPDEVVDAAARLVLPLARFQVLQGRAQGPEDDTDAYAAVRRGYAMTKHSDFESEKLVDQNLDLDFVRRFAIIGTPDQCTARLTALAELGLHRFVIFGPGFYNDGERGASLFSKEVMPAVREWSMTHVAHE
ncbi:LLM class flavin-dependent oxidoreductase [Microbacterium sp. NPDC055357]